MLNTTLKLLASGALVAALGAGTAMAAAATANDADADKVSRTKVRLQVDTRGADRVTFVYAGRSYAGRPAGADDGEREWARTVRAKRDDRPAGSRITFRVRACDGASCTTRTFTERVEWDD